MAERLERQYRTVRGLSYRVCGEIIDPPDGPPGADTLHFGCGPDHTQATRGDATTTTVTDDGRLAWSVGGDPPEVNHIHHTAELLAVDLE